MPTYAVLADVRFDRIFRELEAIVEAFCVGEPRARELFGPSVRYGGPGWSGISYGHTSCLGAELTFPEDSEVGQAPIYGSLCQGIEALQREVDWESAGEMPFYLELWESLRRRFPDRDIAFAGFGMEGPITTAWETRGHGLFTDCFDDPQGYDTFLHLITDSILSYAAYIRRTNGQPAFTEGGAALYDDVASMFGPASWPRLILPHMERYFRAQTSGRRRAHIEDLTPGHLHLLDELGLDTFDPGVSPKLRAADVRDGCNAAFLWRLNGMMVRDFSPERVRSYVIEGVADGASGVFCTISRTMVEEKAVRNIEAFIDAAQRVEQLLGDGCPREDLRAIA